jgi:hypothetical protein
MSSKTDNSSRTVPFVAGLCGVLLTLLIASLLSGPDTALQASIQQFESLDRQEQDRIRNTQTELEKLSPEERGRIEALHASVSSDPALGRKLDEFYGWWSRQPAAVRAELNQLQKDSPTDWLAQVSDRMFQERNKVEEIVVDIRIPGPPRGDADSTPQIRFSVDDYERFLNQIAPPDSLTAEQQATLEELNHRSDQLLARTLWKFESGRPENSDQQRDRISRFRDAMESFEKSGEIMWNDLFSSSDRAMLEAHVRDRIEEWKRDAPAPGRPEDRPEDDNDNRRVEGPDFGAIRRVMVIPVMCAVADQLGQDFRQRHKPAQNDLAQIYEQLTPSKQLELMTRDPYEVSQDLQNQAIIGSEQSGQPIVELTRLLNRFQSEWQRMLSWSWYGGRGFPRGGRDGYRGGRPGSGNGPFPGDSRGDRGRPPERGNRPPNGPPPGFGPRPGGDRPGGERPNGDRPPRDR